jgi:hypothetical protein
MGVYWQNSAKYGWSTWLFGQQGDCQDQQERRYHTFQRSYVSLLLNLKRKKCEQINAFVPQKVGEYPFPNLQFQYIGFH